MTDPNDVTRLLHEFDREPESADRLLPLVYDGLLAIARKRLGRERRGHTLQATALVHEAWMRMVGDTPGSWEHRAHFFGVASEAMRRVLIDHARRHKSQKRGGGQARLALDGLDLAAEHDLDDVLALDEALTRLEAEDQRAARIVKLRYFAGMSIEDTAAALDVSKRTVARDWIFARARLCQLLGIDADDLPDPLPSP